MNEPLDLGRDMICIILLLSVFVWVIVFMADPTHAEDVQTENPNAEAYHD